MGRPCPTPTATTSKGLVRRSLRETLHKPTSSALTSANNQWRIANCPFRRCGRRQNRRTGDNGAPPYAIALFGYKAIRPHWLDATFHSEPRMTQARKIALGKKISSARFDTHMRSNVVLCRGPAQRSMRRDAGGPSAPTRGWASFPPPRRLDTTYTSTPLIEHSSFDASFRVMTSMFFPDFSVNVTRCT